MPIKWFYHADDNSMNDNAIFINIFTLWPFIMDPIHNVCKNKIE